MRLVRPGRQTADIRRRAKRAELDESHWRLVQRLADARLVVTDRNLTGQETVEIIHETLILSWDRLQAWLNEDRAFRIWHDRLRTALGQWEANNRDEEALQRGMLLVEAEERVKTHPADISPPEHEFLQAGIAWRDEQSLAKEAQLERELVQEQQQQAEAQGRATRRLRWLAMGLAVMFLLTVGAGLLAIVQ